MIFFCVKKNIVSAFFRYKQGRKKYFFIGEVFIILTSFTFTYKFRISPSQQYDLF